MAKILANHGGLLAAAMGQTLLLALCGLFFACIIGLVVGLMSVVKNRACNINATIFVDVIRGVPMIVLAFYVFFAVPMLLNNIMHLNTMLGINTQLTLTALQAGTICLALNCGAYMAEIIRAGIESVDKGQMEAARSLGLSAGRTTVKIVLPQAVKIAIPPMVNQFIITLKDTSILTVIGLAEIVNKATQYVSVRYDYFATYVWVGIFYLVFTSLLMILAHYMEKRLSYDRKGSRS